MTAALEWTFNPWRDRPLASVTAAVLGLAGCVVVATLGESAVVTMGLCLAVLGSLSPLLSPARCRADEEGVSRRGPFGLQRRAWNELRRCAERPGGLLVSPYARPHWLDAYRGLLLPLPHRDRDALMAELRTRMKRHGC